MSKLTETVNAHLPERVLSLESGGGAQTFDLGAFTTGGGLSGDPQYGAVTDLGSDGMHLVFVYLTASALDFSTGDPTSGLSVDLEGSIDGTIWADGPGWTLGTPSQNGIPAPSALRTTDPDAPNYTVYGAYITPRFVRPIWAWNEDLPDASATFHITVVKAA